MRRALAVAALLGFSSHVLAEKLPLGWIDLQPCSITESSALRRGQQRATLVLEISAPYFSRVQDELRACAAHAVAAATLPALLKDLPGAAAAFWAEFEVCTRYTEWAEARLSVETTCRY